MRTPLPIAVFVLALAILASSAAAQEEQWLQYRASSDPETDGISTYYRSLETTADTPAGVLLPDSPGFDARFARWETPMVKAGGLWISVARSRQKGDFDMLYIDSNCDGSLKDEKPLKPFSADQYSSRFGPVKITFPGDDGPIVYHVLVECSQYDPESISISLRSGCWYQGTVSVGGKNYPIVLIDYNSNGAFNDTSMDLEQMDRVGLGDGPDRKLFGLGKYISIDGKLYHPQPAPDGAFIAFAPAENVPMAAVAVSPKITSLSLSGENGQLDFQPSGGKVRLPAGKWIVRAWEIARNDSSGAKWLMTGNYFPKESIFDVAQGKEAVLDIGEPVTSTLNVSEDSGQYTIRESLEGKSGENISIERKGENAPAPHVRIRNADGSYNQSLATTYG